MPSSPFPVSPGALGRPGEHPGPVRDGYYPSLTPGTSVRTADRDQTPYLRAWSMTMRLTSFDFGLVNPAYPPAAGDVVHVLEPAWDGVVVSVTQAQEAGSQGVFYTVTASNSAVAYAAPAPFGLSDTPDSATSYGWDTNSLKVTRSITDSGPSVKGSCVIRQEGLWPGMTFTITSALFGLSAQQFSVSNLTVSWPVNAASPVYSIEFGDPMVTLSAWTQSVAVPDGSITATKITDGAITTPKLAANSVTSAAIKAGSIVSDDIEAGAITVVQLAVPQPGGVNLVSNSGFELADFSATADTVYTWTLSADFTGSHVRAATNTTEGDSLTVAAAAY